MAEYTSIVRDIGLVGPVNGMNEPDPSGSYMRLVLIKSEIREERLISIGAAEVLNTELDGCLFGLTSPLAAERETAGEV